MKDTPLSRRALGRLLAGTAASVLGRNSAGAQGLDRGIGGTGMSPEPSPTPDPPRDRGIGGTGVVGTIRGFGSIVVNDDHIDYPPDAMVTIEGRPFDVAALRIGHVVRVLVHSGDHERLATERIDVLHEIVGPVEHASPTTLRVLGQRVRLDRLLDPSGVRWRRGDRVAVSGLRRPDGLVVASRIDRAVGASDRLSGVVQRLTGRQPAIGRLTVSGLAAELHGQRVSLVGHRQRSHFVALDVQQESAALDALRADSLSIEAYVQRRGDTLLAENGPVPGAATDVPGGQAVRAYLTAMVDAGGRLSVTGVTVAGRGDHSAPSGPGGSSGPGGRTGPGSHSSAGSPGQGPMGEPGPEGGGSGMPGFGTGGPGPGGLQGGASGGFGGPGRGLGPGGRGPGGPGGMGGGGPPGH